MAHITLSLLRACLCSGQYLMIMMLMMVMMMMMMVVILMQVRTSV